MSVALFFSVPFVPVITAPSLSLSRTCSPKVCLCFTSRRSPQHIKHSIYDLVETRADVSGAQKKRKDSWDRAWRSPHTAAEASLLPACEAIVSETLGPDAANGEAEVTLSEYTIVLVTCLQTSKALFWKRYASVGHLTDISGHARRLADVRFVDGDAVRDDFLFCNALPGKNTGEEMFSGHDRISWTRTTSVGKLHECLHRRSSSH